MDDLPDLDAIDLAAAIARREVSCVDVMTAFLDRIAEVNPPLTAIVSLRERDVLLAEARDADAHSSDLPLRGVPFAIKDLVETAGIRTTHGSPLFADHVPAVDDLLAARIRAAGAIVIGKTNTPEFGIGSQSYNPVHGTTRNPYEVTKTAGGSSGGAAAALAARLVPLADGSDMMGSLRNPAAFCNVFGFRPSYGRVPPTPEGDTFLHQLATDGPMARSVRDLALLLDVIAGPDERFPHSIPVEELFSERLDVPVAGKRIGWIGDWNGYCPTEPGILPLCERALATFAELGCAVEPVVPDFDPAALWRSWTVLRSWAIASGLRVHFDDPSSRDLLKPEALWEIEAGLALSAADVHAASVIRSEWFASLAGLFEHFDTLALPSAHVFPFDAETHWPKSVAGHEMDTYHRWMEVVVPVSLAGVPALALPAGFGKTGLPTGFQLFGRRGNDLGILQLGHAYDAETRWPKRRPEK
ncbi:amidase [Rhodobium orientis]|uniref:Amidase n=1 Tax=Rhodobium orientis TaxID=34017 RepID=A0A327JMV4_9HYPH|nr:amidase [Rhodobium orientis]MBB4301398.1 amidase [Rhodobium orientis]MBK5951014.1 amidase [Rhodobium orientis]RAI27657.1 amidase [Rhodobium orientis]